MSPTLQPATAADTDLLAAMMREYYTLDGLRFDNAVARRALAALLDDPTLGRAFLILAEDAPAGYAYLTFGFSLEFDGRFALVDELYIREERRGRGLGAMVIGELEKSCRAMGLAAMRLEVEHANEGAQRLYRRLGFTAHERHLMTKWLA